MGTKRLIAGAFVCGVAAIAACLGGAPDESATTQLVLMPSQSFYSFGMVGVGSSATSPAFIISSQGSADDDTIIDITENCGDFDLNLVPSPQGYRVYCETGGSGTDTMIGTGSGACFPNSYAFTADFIPVGPGGSSCTVRVDYMPTGGGPPAFFNITLDGDGVAPESALSINPPSGSTVQFGDIPINQTSSSQPVTITNMGQTTLNVTSVLSGPYVITNGQAQNPTLGPGSAASYDVACEPTATGPAPGSFDFSSAAPPVGVVLDCNGTDATSLSVSPNPGAFSPALVGKPPDDLDIAITNNGAAATLSVSLATTMGAELSFASGGDPNGQQLGPGETAHAILHYAAGSERPMGQLGTLNIDYSPGGSNIAVAINGEALTGTLGVSPGTAIDFGPVCIGATVTQPVTLYASAAGRVDVSSVTAPQAPFSATSTTGMLQGNHGNMLMLVAGVAPTAPGDLSDKLVVHTNLPVPDQEVALTAKALPAGVSATPANVHFGPTRTMMTTTAKEVVVSNCSAGPLKVAATRIEGADAADFAVVSAPPSQPIAERGSSSFLVVMTPHGNGGKQAQLVIEFDGGSVTTVPLDGNGFGGDDASGGEKGTYYSCNAGGASAFGAGLGLAILAILRRRRR